MISKVQRLIRYLVIDRNESLFIRHNKRIWEEFICPDAVGEILLELDSVSSSIISFSYLANILAKKHRATITGYVTREISLRAIISNRIIKKIYQSFNVRKFNYYKLNNNQSIEIENLFNEIKSSLKSKKEVEDLKVQDVWIGDLLYDSYTKIHKLPTIDISDTRFHETLKDALGHYVYWRDYFSSHNVKAVILTHCVYYQPATILRIAISRKIPVYQINATHAYYMTEKNLRAYTDFFYHPEQFKELSKQEQEEGLRLAKEQLQRRFSGEVGVDMNYSTKSAYAKTKKNKIISDTSRINILIATHCFFDSPHPYGVNLFPDFFEWMSFLGEISKKTDYNWYIKTHPDFMPGNIAIIDEFIKKYPKFRLIPSDTSHLQLIEEGINFALTVYGTIGFEYAALGIPVINCSLCNPRIRYNINFHPRTVEEYENLLLHLSDAKLDINVDDVYETYFMNYLNNSKNWLFNDYEMFLKNIGGYYKQIGSVSYQEFLKELSREKHNKIIDSINKFVNSKDYCFQKKHMV
jgi:hypothetical protein